MSAVLLVVEGHHLPGLRCGSHTDVHVGVQLRREPAHLVPADAELARWELEIEVVHAELGPDLRGPDFRGPAVQGRRGARFVYLTWGEGGGSDFAMFRRAKLMLDDLPDVDAAEVRVRVHLTDECGLPRCARLRPPAVEWVAPDASDAQAVRPAPPASA